MFSEIKLDELIIINNDKKEFNSELESEVINIEFNETFYTRQWWKVGNIPETEVYKIVETLIQEGKTFDKNEPILVVKGTIHGSGNFIVKCPFGGRLKSITKKESFSVNENILEVQKYVNDKILDLTILEERLTEISDIEIAKTIDEFTDEWTIAFTKVLSEKTPYIKIYDANSAYSYLGLSFTNHNGYSYLDILSTMDSFSLSIGDEIILLFEGGVRHNIKFEKPGSGTKGYRHNRYTLNAELLKLFLSSELLKIKVMSMRKSLYTVCSFENSINWNSSLSLRPQYSASIIGKFALRLMAYRFIEKNLNNNS